MVKSVQPSQHPRRGLSRFFSPQRFFSPRIEDSLRLRMLALAALWLAATSLLWVGGGNLPILGAGIGTVGYWAGWRWRYQKSLVKSLVIAFLVIGLSIYMRPQMLEALTGNWLPLGQFLILVQALSSFDSRSRGGLYSGMVLSGTVLFFASQQAFEPSFGIFIMGFIVVLLSFLTLSFLEDSILGAKVHWVHHKLGRPGMLPYWVGISCAVFMLSGLAFWLMPRGELNLVGSAQLSVLPYSGVSLDPDYRPPEIDPSQLISMPDPQAIKVPEAGELPETASNAPADGATIAGPVNQKRQTQPQTAIPSPGPMLGNPEASANKGRRDFTGLGVSNPRPRPGYEPVFYVRTTVTSYWRGRTYQEFDGQGWRANSASNNLTPSRTRDGIWFNQANLNRDSQALYQQTFYIREDSPDAIFTGYSALSVEDLGSSLDGVGVESGATYRVLSAYPAHNPARLRRDSTWVADRSSLEVPAEFGNWLFPLADRITSGAASDFEKVERIVSYLRREGGTFLSNWPQETTGTARLEEFLLDGQPGNAMDYATATVMLARASGLPTRLAVGYLPGSRDPLSGAYKVRRSDAHAWAEIYFAKGGWIPFDSSPRGDLAAGGTAASRVGFLFNAGVGDAAFDAARSAPSHLVSAVIGAMNNPVLAIIGPSILLAVLALRWVYFRQTKERIKSTVARSYQGRLSGEGRQELLALYRKLEKLLRRMSGQRREPWQTVSAYAGQTRPLDIQTQSELAWFTRAIWRAAYDPEELPEGIVAEARNRLRQVGESLKAAGKSNSQRQA